MSSIAGLLLTVLLATAAAQDGESDSEILARLMENYDKSEPPATDRSTQVRLGVYINNFYAINEKTMDYSISFYLRQSWRDPRLAFGADDSKRSLKLNNEEKQALWLPDTFFRNEKGASFHHVTVPNQLFKVNATGHVWYVLKLTATLSCPMKLQKFPLDTQSCPMMFESFSYTSDVMYFGWLDRPVEVDPGVQLPQFTLNDVILYDCSQNYTAGSFTCLEIRYVLRRDVGFFVMQYYFPSILLVVLSWAAFWMERDNPTARVVLGLLVILALFTLNSGLMTSLPRVSYIKAIDLWISVCLVFVFASLLEYAVVEALGKKKRNAKDEEADGGDDRRAKMDTLAKIIFPVAFLLFNILYWMIYSI